MVSQSVIEDIITKAILDVKCNDGTSFSKGLRSSLDGFAKQYGGLTDHEELSIYDNQGNELLHQKGDSHGVEVDESELMRENYRDLHLTHNHPTLWTDNVPTYFSNEDLQEFIHTTNDNGEDLYKSMSAETPNGARVTLIKTNDYNPSKNRGDLLVASFELSVAANKYLESYKDKVIEYMTNKAIEYQDSHPGEFIKATVFHDEASEAVIKEIGTMEQYLKKGGYYDAIKNANCKYRITWKN